MKQRWINIAVLAGLAFYVSGAAQFIHLNCDHMPSRHASVAEDPSPDKPAGETPDSHSECSLCQDMAVMRAMSLEPPAVSQVLQATNETVQCECSVSLFSASYIILFPRPPPVFPL